MNINIIYGRYEYLKISYKILIKANANVGFTNVDQSYNNIINN